MAESSPEEVELQKQLIRDTYGDMKGWELIDMFLGWMEPNQIGEIALSIEEATQNNEEVPDH